MADRTWNSPNFATSSINNTIKFNTSAKGASGKSEGYSDVTIVNGASTNFTNTRALMMPVAPAPKTAGSASFANGSSISLGNLVKETIYPFNVANVSASIGTTVLVFKG